MINSQLRRQLQEQLLNNKAVNQEFDRTAEKFFQRAKQKMLRAFDAHVVTQELESTSGSGLLPRGTLFGFLGFEKGDNPIEPLRALLEKSIILRPGKAKKNTATKSYAVVIPSVNELYAATPLPWAPGRSWVKAVEFGISGLGNYMAIESDRSRSGEGIQVKSANLGGKFKNTSYISSILKNFQKELLSSGIKIL